VDALGTLNVAGPNNIGDASAVTVNGTLNLTVDNETIGSLAGSGSVNLNVAAKALTTGGNNASTTFSGTIAGLGGLTKAGAGNFTLSNNNGYTGATLVNGGILTIADAGAIDNSISVTVAAGATLTGTVAYTTKTLTNHGFVFGNLTVNGNLANDGKFSPGNGAGSVGTILVNGDVAAAASPGTAVMEVNVNLPSSPGVNSDFVHITGAMGAGSFIAINQTNVLPGVATTGNGILLWKIDGTSTAGQFALAGPVVSAGTPYQYLLNYVTDYTGTSDGVFLKSGLRQEFYGDAALLSGEQAVIRSCFRSDQRVPDSPHARDHVRAWAEVETASFKTDVKSGLRMDEKMNCVTGGIDLGLGEGVRFGVVGGYGGSSIDIGTPGGTGTLDGTTTAIEGLFSMGTPQYFFNVTAGYASTDWTFTGPVAAAIDATNNATQKGIIGSAQAGTTVNLTPFRFKFIAAVNYDHTTCGKNCLLNGTSESTGIVDAKGTIRVEAMTHQINPYVAVSFSDDLAHGDTVSYGSESLTVDTAHDLLTLSGGFNAPLDEGVLLFGDASVLNGLGNTGTTGYSVAGGLKAYW